MSNKRMTREKRKRIHAPGAEKGIGLCGERGKSSNVVEKINCLDCGRRAQEAIDALHAHLEAEEAKAHERQRDGLAALQQPRWWESQQRTVDG